MTPSITEDAERAEERHAIFALIPEWPPISAAELATALGFGNTWPVSRNLPVLARRGMIVKHGSRPNMRYTRAAALSAELKKLEGE